MSELIITPGCIVLIEDFDDIPAHLFLVDEVLGDYITGKALTGPLTGEYGEPALTLIIAIIIETNTII